jgi:hypothetical protein
MLTSFEYELANSESRDIMERGFNNFTNTAAFVLAFNYPRIKLITIRDDEGLFQLKKSIKFKILSK